MGCAAGKRQDALCFTAACAGRRRARRKRHHHPRSLKERLYERFLRVPVKYIDWFIGACVAAIVLFTILGMLKGRGYF